MIVNRFKTYLTLAAVALLAAREAGAQVSYEFLRPLPNFSSTIGTEASLTEYLQDAFYLILGLSTTAAVVMAIAFGFAYMTSDVVITKENAKKHLTQIAWGIGLLLSAYLILVTINPALVNLDAGIRNLRTEVKYVESPNARVGNGSMTELGRRELNNTDPARESICQRAQSTLMQGSMGPYECEVRVFDPAQYISYCQQLQADGVLCNPVETEIVSFRGTCSAYRGYWAQSPTAPTNNEGTRTEYCACRAGSTCAQAPY